MSSSDHSVQGTGPDNTTLTGGGNRDDSTASGAASNAPESSDNSTEGGADSRNYGHDDDTYQADDADGDLAEMKKMKKKAAVTNPPGSQAEPSWAGGYDLPTQLDKSSALQKQWVDDNANSLEHDNELEIHPERLSMLSSDNRNHLGMLSEAKREG